MADKVDALTKDQDEERAIMMQEEAMDDAEQEAADRKIEEKNGDIKVEPAPGSVEEHKKDD